MLEHGLFQNRRKFLSKLSLGIGSVALGSLLIPDLFSKDPEEAIMAGLPRFAPRAKRIIYLFQNGAPSQLDLFDHKPLLQKMHGQDLPASIRMGQRLTGMTSGQEHFPLAGSIFQFGEYGRARAQISELLPYTAGVVDDLCIIKTLYTEAINHDPALTFFSNGRTGRQQAQHGRLVKLWPGQREQEPPCILRTPV
ncbi:DUF1501 domain-containing protein [Paraflavitalea speifideaquila]|uniref:DUF1501 domain-containing protein n=1 Tax=Paraflavitalea speifideaquila TaxID=3076558 RepID=UPI0028ED13BE|nr:DUF1501 domain-containing protein [Paraflavitalea speifideiaquila]